MMIARNIGSQNKMEQKKFATTLDRLEEFLLQHKVTGKKSPKV
ncbi:hypothetical protein P9G84_02520 [Brevibacillus centrosporus]|nr:hypothetical protein [Brevibacillus centrosporus]MEC2127868.1 hypothetical protein [Brevibacillus centrosporus]GED32113.1 hypothetical protein BCE02nite_32540 [Brevibacillus centrosporus]